MYVCLILYYNILYVYIMCTSVLMQTVGNTKVLWENLNEHIAKARYSKCTVLNTSVLCVDVIKA